MHICSKTVTSLVIIFVTSWINIVRSDSDVNVNAEQGYLSLLGNINFEQQPTYFDDMKIILQNKESNDRDYRNRRQRELEATPAGCDPEKVDLADYPQWNAEVGYWIGEYTFLGADGNPYVSSLWNYRYDHYKGFITGNVKGNKYRQRNIFMYPPQNILLCKDDNSTVGDGKCGVNGNSKLFMADQAVTTCSNNTELRGDIQGRYQGVFKTRTELIGRDNALLYQVYLDKDIFQFQEDRLFQSQLTTLTKDDSGEFRTRTAQNFPFSGGLSSNQASYYRERKIVSKKAFYDELHQTKKDYKVKKKDLCGWENDNAGRAIATLTSGTRACKEHLKSSFDL